MTRPGFRELFREKGLWLLKALSTVFFAGPLLPGRTDFFRDLYLRIFPQRVQLVDLVRSEGLQSRDPYLHGGQPFLGEISNAAFYPYAILGFVLRPVVVFNVEIVLHFLLAASPFIFWHGSPRVVAARRARGGARLHLLRRHAVCRQLRILALPNFPLSFSSSGRLFTHGSLVRRFVLCPRTGVDEGCAPREGARRLPPTMDRTIRGRR